MNDSDNRHRGTVTVGQSVYDENGGALGNVQAIDRSGFYVLSPGRERARKPITQLRDVTGTAYVMWRCSNCGEMGHIGGSLPRHCPNCRAAREELFYWAED